MGQAKQRGTLEQIKAILEGIDKTEGESDDGWWETSSGAEFGAKQLAAIEALFSHGTSEEQGNT